MLVHRCRLVQKKKIVNVDYRDLAMASCDDTVSTTRLPLVQSTLTIVAGVVPSW
jgi:hypothetical protein